MLSLKTVAKTIHCMVSFTANKKMLIGFVLLVSVLYAIFALSQYFTPTIDESCPVDAPCPHAAELEFLYGAVPLIASIGIAIGALIYYFMSSKAESKEKGMKKTADVLLQFLNSDEKKVVDLLIENKGKVLQSELTRLPGMTKVKSHRIVQKLADRGVIESEHLGKTNVVKFRKEIMDGLF